MSKTARASNRMTTQDILFYIQFKIICNIVVLFTKTNSLIINDQYE